MAVVAYLHTISYAAGDYTARSDELCAGLFPAARRYACQCFAHLFRGTHSKCLALVLLMVSVISIPFGGASWMGAVACLHAGRAC